jgi:hypothetical protein
MDITDICCLSGIFGRFSSPRIEVCQGISHIYRYTGNIV